MFKHFTSETTALKKMMLDGPAQLQMVVCSQVIGSQKGVVHQLLAAIGAMGVIQY